MFRKSSRRQTPVDVLGNDGLLPVGAFDRRSADPLDGGLPVEIALEMAREGQISSQHLESSLERALEHPGTVAHRGDLADSVGDLGGHGRSSRRDGAKSMSVARVISAATGAQTPHLPAGSRRWAPDPF